MKFDPPVYSVTLKMGERDPHKPLLYYSGEGKDACNTFYLQGVVNTETGITGMVKSYENLGHRWNNIGVVTPFGIFTSWGRPAWGGWALLWKTSWCVGSAGDKVPIRQDSDSEDD